MSQDVWAAQGTNPDAIEAALRDLLRRRHAENEDLAPARVLNLVVILDRDWKGEISNRLERVGRYHASRTVVCVVEDGRTGLDASATVSYEDSAPGRIGVIRELVEIDLGPGHLEALQTIVDPVLASEMPTVVWSPHGHEDAVRRLLSLTDVILLDSDDQPDPAEAFARADALCRDVYVVDLAWLRTTPWRERIAASFDLSRRVQGLWRMDELEVRHQQSSTASGLLLAGWLASRLGWDTAQTAPRDGGDLVGTVGRQDGTVTVRLRPQAQSAPGLGGVTVSCRDGLELSLQRGDGGLDAREVDASGSERRWKILGASRGEGGILGEGVRQALLRDPTYDPALRAARELCPA
ncbi:MAG TPA: glucose-6-phosphate dehydrogenase assembly protein OpcA [Solirubrobacteraceae bacterium]|nr:glucose-6-phosphate dehydrogenase assembly protein OpcA [Solirubrobacteraceae bacterium]